MADAVEGDHAAVRPATPSAVQEKMVEVTILKSTTVKGKKLVKDTILEVSEENASKLVEDGKAKISKAEEPKKG